MKFFTKKKIIDGKKFKTHECYGWGVSYTKRHHPFSVRLWSKDGHSMEYNMSLAEFKHFRDVINEQIS